MILAFDLGGTRLKAGGIVADTVVRATTQDAPDGAAAVATLVEVGQKLLDGERAERVGLCVPGIVEDGRVVALPGKLAGIAGIDLAGALGDAFGCPALVVNDAIAAGLGEARHGAGRGARRAVIVTIGTGVGVCALEDGVPLGRGPLGGGILGGQMPIGTASGGTDTSGRHGTLEAICRAQRIVELANAAGGSFDAVEEVYAAHASGEPAATLGIDAYRADLVRGLAALAHAHAPDVIVVGGGPIVTGDPITPGLTDELAPHLFAGYHVQVRAAALGDHAALLGLGHLP